jgi:hypothetical protein
MMSVGSIVLCPVWHRCPAQVGSAQVDSAQVGPAQVGTEQVSSAQVGSAQVGLAQLAPIGYPAQLPLLRLARSDRPRSGQPRSVGSAQSAFLRSAPPRLALLRSALLRSARSAGPLVSPLKLALSGWHGIGRPHSGQPRSSWLTPGWPHSGRPRSASPAQVGPLRLAHSQSAWNRLAPFSRLCSGRLCSD